MYVRVLDLPTLRAILAADTENEGQLSYLIDGQRTQLLYKGDKATATESITLLASLPAPVRLAMDAYPELFIKYTENELFDHDDFVLDEYGVKTWYIDDDGFRVNITETIKRTTDVFDLFHDTAPYTVTDEDGTRTITPPVKPLVIAR